MEYYWWLIAALILFVLEIVIPGFVILWFGVGALVAALLDFIGIHDIMVQTLVFSLVSIVLVALSRTLFKRFFIRNSPGAEIKTNADALIGLTCLVTEEINNLHSSGRIQVNSQDWVARSSTGETIPVGTIAVIERIDGIKLFVKKYEG
jgi:membrane protein implicated in regulation of membrane protease activity